MTIDEFVNKSETIHVHITQEMKEQFIRYISLLQTWNQKMNLTAIDETEEIIEKHFYDCVLPLSDFDLKGTCADVGSGAGFPGIVWKIVKPDVDMTLIEPTGKRCHFLEAVITELGLKDIQVINERAEDFASKYRESFDVVTARAVANMSVLSELCIPLVKADGLFVAMKGMHGKEEAQQAAHALDVLGVQLLDMSEVSLYSGDHRVNLIYKKVKQTPMQYPRNYGTIKKKPL